MIKKINQLLITCVLARQFRFGLLQRVGLFFSLEHAGELRIIILRRRKRGKNPVGWASYAIATLINPLMIVRVGRLTQLVVWCR